jgi:hypothetical protein
MPRREFIDDCEVKDTKTVQNGERLPEGELLVKLRNPDGKTIWVRMAFEEFKRRKRRVSKELEAGRK